MTIEVAVSSLPLHKTFFYEYHRSIPVGTRVLVDFRGRRTTAYVVGEGGSPPEGIRLKKVVQVVDPEPLVDERDVEMAKRVSETFLAPLGKVMDLYFSGFGDYVSIKVVEDGVGESVWKWIQKNGIKRARELIVEGTLSIVTSKSSAFTAGERRRFVELVASVDEIAGMKLGENQMRVINYLSAKSREELHTLLARLDVQKRVVSSLEKRGIVRIVEMFSQPWTEEKRVRLTPEQRRVRDDIKNDPSSPHLLMGITGSGKTEVYFELIEDALSKGKSALLLVPEISLTPQTVARVRGRFPDAGVYPYHSDLSKRDRALVWWKAVVGEPRTVVVGTRSALWIPFSNLGIIVVDEEHDESYYQTTEPCYDATVVAKVKAEVYDIPLILSSASPSLTTYYEAITGRMKLHVLRERPIGSVPKIELVDMRGRGPEEWIISDELAEYLEKTLKSGKIAFVLATRKAYANYVVCTKCGYVFKCPNCDVGLSYHRGTNVLKCHHCGYTTPIPSVCPRCGSKELSAKGYGTERVEYELIKRFPAAKIVRFDRESVTSPTETERFIREIVEGKCDIVVGTKIISKGLDAPNVALVAVIDADRNLSIPSFSSKERLFQLLVQMSGRSGRRGKGVALIQTLDPENEFFRFVERGDYEGFARFEFEKRRIFHYPPFSSLVRLVASSRDPSAALETLESIAHRLRNEGLEILGPTEAPIAKIRGEYRYHMMIKLDHSIFRELSPVLAELLDDVERGKVRVSSFVNPRTTFP